jgi:cytochrome c
MRLSASFLPLIIFLPLTLVSCSLRTDPIPTGGDRAAGGQHIYRLGCGSCHTIPGIVGAHGKVGPSLEGVARRNYVAGELLNQPANLEHWIQHPHSVHPDTLMPELGVNDAQSRDIAAYLYSLN